MNAVRWLAENSVRRAHNTLFGQTDAITYQPGHVVKVAASLFNVFDSVELPKQSVGARLAVEGQKRVPCRMIAIGKCSSARSRSRTR